MMNLVSSVFLWYVLTHHFWSFIWVWWPAQHLSLLLCLKPKCFTVGYHKFNLMKTKKEYQVQAQSWSQVHSDLKRLKDTFSLYFIFHLPSHCVWTPKVSFSSLLQQKLWQVAKSKWVTSEESKVKNEAMGEGRASNHSVKNAAPPEFAWCGFLLISISIRNEKFVTKGVCSLNAKLPALQ